MITFADPTVILTENENYSRYFELYWRSDVGLQDEDK